MPVAQPPARVGQGADQVAERVGPVVGEPAARSRARSRRARRVRRRAARSRPRPPRVRSRSQQPEVEGLGGRDPAPGRGGLGRERRRRQRGEPAGPEHGAEARAGEPQRGARQAEAYVGRERQVGARADRRALDDRDGEGRAGGEPLEQQLDPDQAQQQVGVGLLAPATARSKPPQKARPRASRTTTLGRSAGRAGVQPLDGRRRRARWPARAGPATSRAATVTGAAPLGQDLLGLLAEPRRGAVQPRLGAGRAHREDGGPRRTGDRHVVRPHESARAHDRVGEDVAEPVDRARRDARGAQQRSTHSVAVRSANASLSSFSSSSWWATRSPCVTKRGSSASSGAPTTLADAAPEPVVAGREDERRVRRLEHLVRRVARVRGCRAAPARRRSPSTRWSAAPRSPSRQSSIGTSRWTERPLARTCGSQATTPRAAYRPLVKSADRARRP